MLLRQSLSEKLFASPAGTKSHLCNSLFSNILRANPLLAIFYADLFRHHSANSSIFKDLQIQSTFFLIQIDPPKTTTSDPPRIDINKEKILTIGSPPRIGPPPGKGFCREETWC
jgi:hypothetical protein